MKKQTKANIDKIREILKEMYPSPKAELNFTNPFETLVATILSAQATDKQVNKATPALFRDYPTAEKMAAATPEEIFPYVRSCGFHSKATNLVMTARRLVSDFGGKVPSSMEDLTSLPGVGRKTANVVRANAFQIPSFAVDTHVFRVSNRLGLVFAKNVRETEKQLEKNIPKEDWIDCHHRLILHGRRLCKAPTPKCEDCPLQDLCKYHQEQTAL
jgi:endonuclease-3